MINGHKIAGVMAISDFEMAPQMVAELSKFCDVLILRYDVNNGVKSIWKACQDAVPAGMECYLIRGREKWNRWNWREDMIRRLDPIKPDYVLFLDSDEKYSSDFSQDFQKFIDLGSDFMMFDYEMITNNSRNVRKYPGARHCKAFKWAPRIGYRPYKGYAKPTWPKKEGPKIYNATSKILHFCFYTQEMENTKIIHK